MSLSLRTLETLIDLLEIKLSCFEPHDRDDKRELANLERSLAELRDVMTEVTQHISVVAFRGR